jgi:hypothetical protein
MNFMIRAKRIFVGIFAVIWIGGALGQDVNVKVQQGTLMGVSQQFN